ncbi:MAG: hypothetical protein JNM56_00910 [Planctomycetia bacterium]|nr:hypothetical protein [Planctomycetia bacterium]
MRWDDFALRSHTIRVAVILALLGVGLLTGLTTAQQPPGPGLPQPRLLTIMPMGGKAGDTVELTFTGQDIEEPQGLLFSHTAIKSELLPQPPQPTPDPKAKGAMKGAGPPVAVKYKVTLPADLPLGIHDVRVFNKWGVSNPRAFVVGDQTDITETEPNNDVDKAQKVEMNTTINGVISAPIDVDYFQFKGTKGQRVVISCLASSIDSRLHPVIELYDQSGRRLGVNRDYHNTDAVLDAVLQTDGEYLVRVFQFTHTVGTAEYFYRLTISTAPWIDSMFPSTVEPGKATQVTIHGKNLPGGQPDPDAVLHNSVLEKAVVTVTAPNDPLARQRLAINGHVSPTGGFMDGFEYRVKGPAGSSNPFLLNIADAPVVLENPANTKREAAQEVTTPCIVSGKLDKKHPHGWFGFAAKKGDVLSIEAQSDRLGSPTDLLLQVYAADGKAPITELDDDPEILSPNQFYNSTRDPQRYKFTAPADGKFQVLVKSQDSTQLGPRNYYQLRIAPESPDFRLVLLAPTTYLPEAPVLPQGGQRELAVYIGRQDSFNGDIALSADGLPPGVTCAPQTVSPGAKSALLVLSAAPDAQPWVGEIKVKGTATINGQPVVREARAASVTWPGQAQQANLPVVARMDRGVVLAVRDKGPFNLTASVEKPMVMQGDKLSVPLKLERHWADFKQPLQVVLASPLLPGVQPQAQPITIAPVTIAADKAEGSAVVDVKATTPPGNYTLVFRGTAQIPFGKDPAKKANANIVLPSTPVVVTVLPKQLGTVTLTPPNGTGKLGGQSEVTVKVARMYDFNGEFKVELVLPPNAKGLAAPEVTIPAGKDEAKLVINIAGDAAPGNLQGLLVKATAMYNGSHPTVQEAKFSLNVQK